MFYQVSFTKQAARDLKHIQEPYYSKIKKAIIGLSETPQPVGSKKLKGRDAYRVRVADYRIIYEINDKIVTIDIIRIGHRKNIYKK